MLKPRLQTTKNIQIRSDVRLNRYETGDKTLILNGVDFIVITDKEGLSPNPNPEGLYINANSVIEYIKRNLFGHDKNKYGIDK